MHDGACRNQKPDNDRSCAAHNAARATAGEQDYSSLFPKALPGWTAGKVESRKTIEEDFFVPITRIQLTRSYVHDRTKGRVDIVIDTFDAEAS